MKPYRLLSYLPIVIWLAVVCQSSRPARAEITPAAVNNAIDRGVAFLRRQQKGGRWPTFANYPGGVTALSTLALLNAGVPPDDPAIRSALAQLRKLGEPTKTYTTALQTMVFCAAEPKKDRLLIRRNVRWLERIQWNKEGLRGGWNYGGGSSATPDNSNSQFALLALNEAERVGVRVNPEVWQRAYAYWNGLQQTDGGWPYRGNRSSGSMTCAGICSLVIAAQSLSHGDAWLTDGRVLCCGLQEEQVGIERGLRWLGNHFRVNTNPGGAPNWTYYYLYGLERVGRLTGRRFIGDHDWYRAGAEYLVSQQSIAGSWSSVPSQQSAHSVINTSFALLFLSKGRRPVLLSKLRREPLDDWNRHRSDIANLTKHVESLWEQNLAWQFADLRAANVEDLLQSPVLFLSGRDGLSLNAADKKKLFEYINQGGFLFAENCCNGTNFHRQFLQLMAELFPDNPLRLLPIDHPVWYAEQPVDPEYAQPLWGIDACCRTSVVYSPQDLGCYWELARRTAMPYPAEVEAKVKAALAMGANVVTYATDRQLRDRLDVPQIAEETPVSGTFGRGRLYVAKLDHSGGSDDAPAALTNLLRVVQDQLELRVDPQRRLIRPTDPSLPDFPIAFLHGRRSFRWSTNERKAIREFLQNGGVMFADAICASQEFAQSFRQEMQAILPDHPLQRVPPDHPLFTEEYRGWDLARVSLRTPATRTDKNERLTARVEQVTPRLEGVEIDGRYIVLFSPYDISCAMENHQSLECQGYIRADAARIGVNVILYALQQ